MYSHYTLLIAALSLVSVSAHAQELSNRTIAEATPIGERQVSIDLNARFDLVTEGRPTLQESDIIATWQRAGGIQPTPFRVLIPAGCFVEQRGRLRVNGTSCGVQVSLDGRMLEADGFVARAVPPEPINPGEPLRLRIRLSVDVDEARAGNLLSTLGGAEVSLAVGRESGIALPKSIDAVSGIDPTPF